MDTKLNFSKALHWAALAPAMLLASLSNAQAGHGHPARLPAPSGDQDFQARGPAHEAKVALGRLLFFDKELSGNRNISCATCHHALTDTGDGLSLPIGEGGRGLGITRDTGSGADAVVERVPRNAPPLFNLGALEFVRMFHDGRVSINPNHPSGFNSPAGDDLPAGLENILAAQAMFPVTSATEMAGQVHDGVAENEIAAAANAGDLPAIWDLLGQRLRAIPEYVERFQQAFPQAGIGDDGSGLNYVLAANAIAAFEASAWRADNSPFDRYLRGERRALSPAARRGMRLFYGKAGCAGCHSGALQTDHGFHAIAMPQVGPGKGDNLPGYNDGHDDFGHQRVSGNPADQFRFRTPSLRNVALTAPYGHGGAYATLEAVVRHHLDPVASLHNYDPSQLALPAREDLDAKDLLVMSDPNRVAAIAAANQLPPRPLRERDVQDLLSFLHALTDPASIDLRHDVPARLPSGLPLAD